MQESRPTKTCIVCGLDKPMTAYLQLTGPKGTAYGSVCATCRGSGLGRVAPKLLSEEETETASGLRIDSKNKVQSQVDKKEIKEKIKEDRVEEKEKKDFAKEKKEERKTLTAEEERIHRETVIQPKKVEGFLNYRSKTPFAIANPAKVESSPTDPQAAINNAEQVKTENVTLDTRKTRDDLSAPFRDQHTTQANRDNAFYRDWENMIGESVVTKTVRRQFLGKKGSASGTPSTDTSKKEKNPAVDFIQKTWGPKSSK